MPSFTQSVMDKKGLFTSTINDAYTSTISKIGEIRTNIIYTIKHSDISFIPLIQRKEIIIKNNGSFVQLLGVRYNYENSYRFIFVYRNIYWLTYRQGIKEI